MSDPHAFVQEALFAIHRRNGGTLVELNWHWRLLEPELGLDSLDLAEIVIAVERQYGIRLFDAPDPPQTWGDVVDVLTQRERDATKDRTK